MTEDGGEVLNAVIQDYNPLGAGQSAISEATGIKSIKDISFYQTQRTFTLMFGKAVLDFDKEVLMKPEIRENLSKINITIKIRKKDGLIDVFYKGEKVREVISQ